MSLGGNAPAESIPKTAPSPSARLEPADIPDEPDLKSLLEQLNYCIALAKRLSDESVAKARKQ